MAQETEVRQLFEDYREAFNAGDAVRAARWYSNPAFVVKNGDVVRFGAADKDAHFAALMQGNAEQGEHAWDLTGCDITFPAQNGAVVVAHWTCRRADGSVIWDFDDTYLLALEHAGWRILGDIVHDA